MLRRSAVMFGPKPKVVSAGTVTRADGSAKAFDVLTVDALAGVSALTGNSAIFSGILGKSAKDPVALVGRAMCFIREGNVSGAVADLKAAKKSSKPELKKTVAALSARCTHLEVEAVHKADDVARELAASVKYDTDSWSTSLLQGDLELFLGDANGSGYTNAEALLQKELEELSGAQCVSVAGTSAAAELVALMRCQPRGCTASDLFAQADISEAVKAAKAENGWKNIGDCEVMVLSEVLANAQTNNFGVLRPVHESSNARYALWNREGGAKVRSLLQWMYGGATSEAPSGLQAQLDAAMAEKAAGKAAKATGKSVKDAVAEFQKDPEQAPSLLAYLESTCPEAFNQNGVEHEKFINTVSKVFGSSDLNQAHGSDSYYSNVKTLAKALVQQHMDRAMTGRAAQLMANQTKAANFAEINRLLSDVRGRGSYLQMWQVLQLRGTANQRYGRVAEAETDFKILHELKMTPHGVDIPVLDENRYRSAF